MTILPVEIPLETLRRIMEKNAAQEPTNSKERETQTYRKPIPTAPVGWTAENSGSRNS